MAGIVAASNCFAIGVRGVGSVDDDDDDDDANEDEDEDEDAAAEAGNGLSPVARI